jgi:hypothetical protein
MYDSVPVIDQARLLSTQFNEGLFEFSKDLEMYET